MDLLREQFPTDNFTLLAFIIALPLLGALINGVFGKRMGKEAVRLLGLTVIALSFVGGVAMLLVIATHHGEEGAPALRVSWLAWHWLKIGPVPIDVKFSADALSATMTLVVTGIGFLIHLYSTGYMAKDPGYHRFFAYLNLFIFSMLVLILGDNLAVLFVGWEGVGLCSYLLIGFWFDDEKKAAAGKKAFITNRIGDFGLLVAMAMLLVYAGTLSWTPLEQASAGTRLLEAKAIWPLPDLARTGLPSFLVGQDGWLIPDSCGQAPMGWPNGCMDPWTIHVATFVGLFLFLGCVGKSAQIPLYVWLPDAMAGPTPVSALIHAATMVTAGVYLVARMSFLFVLSPFTMAVIAGTGAATALLAASIAFAQTDLKKVLAYSTVSQLGFMFIGVGSGAFSAGFFHVFTHAFFKGCLFLCAGSVIHMMHHRLHGDDAPQDMRNMGGLRKHMPITHWTYLISCLAIAGCPPLAGFFSKDEILWKAFSTHIVASPRAPSLWTAPPWYGQLIYALGIVAAVGTAFYMFRSYFLTFWGDFRGWRIVAGYKAPRHGHHDDHGHDEALKDGPVPSESPWAMTLPLAILAAGAAVVGFLYAEPLHIAPLEHFLKPVFTTALGHVADPTVQTSPYYDPEVVKLLYPLLGVGVAAFVTGAGAAYFVYQVRAGQPAASFVKALPWLHNAVYKKWKVDELYEVTVIGLVDAMGDTAAQFDKWVVDGLLAKLTAVATSVFGTILRAAQTGRVQVYAAAMVVGLAGIGWFLFSPQADAELDEAMLSRNRMVLTAAPGFGYRYRWYVKGEEAPEKFSAAERKYTAKVQKCEPKTVMLEVENLFGSVSRAAFTACREATPAPGHPLPADCCEPDYKGTDDKAQPASPTSSAKSAGPRPSLRPQLTPRRVERKGGAK